MAPNLTAALKATLANRSPTDAGRSTLAQKPHTVVYCPSAKGNIQIPGKTGISPKLTGQAFHKFRSPSYTEQNVAAIKPNAKRSLAPVLPKC